MEYFFHLLNSYYVPDVARAAVICLTVYGTVMAYFTRRTLCARVELERDHFLRTMPPEVLRHVKRVTLWGSSVCIYMAVDAYMYIGGGIRWNTITYLFLTAYFTKEIYPLYYYELALLESRKRQIDDARKHIGEIS